MTLESKDWPGFILCPRLIKSFGATEVLVLASTAFYFLAPNAKISYIPSYLLGLWAIHRYREVFGTVALLKAEPIALSIGALIVYWCVSVLWSPAVSPITTLKTFGYGFLLIAFILSVVKCSQHASRFPTLLCQATVLAGAISAVFSIIPIRPDMLATGRLHALGRLDHAVVSGISYGFALTLAISLLLYSKAVQFRLAWGVACSVLLVALLLSGTRLAWMSAVVSVLIAVMSYCHVGFWRSMAWAGGTLTILLAMAMVIDSIIEPIQDETGWLWPLLKSDSIEILTPNPDLTEKTTNNKPLGVKAVYSNFGSEISFLDGNPGILNLYHPHEVATSAGWPAIRLKPGQLYSVMIRAKSSTSSHSGFYVWMQEYSEDLPENMTHIALNPGRKEKGVVDVSRQVGVVFNEAISNQWSFFLLGYKPGVDAKWASVNVSNWVGMGTRALHIDQLSVFEDHSSLGELRYWLNQQPWVSRGFSNRNWIWANSIYETMSYSALFGFGYSGGSEIVNREGNAVDHPHSIYVSQFYYGGVIGCSLLLALLILCFKVRSETRSLDWALGISGLCFAVLALAFDGGRLVGKLGMVWVVFWTPVILLLIQSLKCERDLPQEAT